MALLMRTRRRPEPAAEVLDRAREVSAEALERATEAAERAREAAEPRIAQALEAAEPRIARAREAAEPRIAQAREASRPALAQARRGLGALLRLLVRLLAVLPGVGARVLEAVSRLLGSLADRSAELAHVEPPSRSGARRSRRRAVLWFTGGFAAGAAAGYAACELTRGSEHRDVAPDEPWQPTAVPDTSTADADG